MKTITASELKNKLDKDEVLLIDVREPTEHRSESDHAKIPISSFNNYQRGMQSSLR
jgi:hypothetical protein